MDFSKLNPDDFVVPSFQSQYLHVASKVIGIMIGLDGDKKFQTIENAVFAKTNIRGFLNESDIKAAGVAPWKLILFCKYGEY